VAGLLLMEVLSSLRGARPRSGWPSARTPSGQRAFPCLGPYPGVHDRLAGHGLEESDAVGVLVRRVETAPLVPDWKHSQTER
jgi:hypothetical protein